MPRPDPGKTGHTFFLAEAHAEQGISKAASVMHREVEYGEKKRVTRAPSIRKVSGTGTVVIGGTFRPLKSRPVHAFKRRQSFVFFLLRQRDMGRTRSRTILQEVKASAEKHASRTSPAKHAFLSKTGTGKSCLSGKVRVQRRPLRGTIRQRNTGRKRKLYLSFLRS